MKYTKFKPGERVKLNRTLDELKEGLTGIVMLCADGKGVKFDGNHSVSVGRKDETGKYHRVIEHVSLL